MTTCSSGRTRAGSCRVTVRPAVPRDGVVGCSQGAGRAGSPIRCLWNGSPPTTAGAIEIPARGTGGRCRGRSCGSRTPSRSGRCRRATTPPGPVGPAVTVPFGAGRTAVRRAVRCVPTPRGGRLVGSVTGPCSRATCEAARSVTDRVIGRLGTFGPRPVQEPFRWPGADHGVDRNPLLPMRARGRRTAGPGP
jgi:hypothetical protein